jgi:hypothetical protein
MSKKQLLQQALDTFKKTSAADRFDRFVGMVEEYFHYNTDFEIETNFETDQLIESLEEMTRMAKQPIQNAV